MYTKTSEINTFGRFFYAQAGVQGKEKPDLMTSRASTIVPGATPGFATM